jgi:hypothetical protein
LIKHQRGIRHECASGEPTGPTASVAVSAELTIFSSDPLLSFSIRLSVLIVDSTDSMSGMCIAGIRSTCDINFILIQIILRGVAAARILYDLPVIYRRRRARFNVMNLFVSVVLPAYALYIIM